ncbi:MAG: ATP-binding protein [Stellaceae bacterium]
MISKPIHDIGLTDLDALVGRVAEGKTLEYKREMPAGTREERIKFLAAVSSLANTAGGDLLIGVEAKDGIPVAIPGVSFTNLDDEKLRLENLLIDGIEPRIPRVEIAQIACASGASTLVIRVHRSWLAPHRVKLNDKFYGRNSAGKYPLDVTELRSAFVLSESTAEKIRSFRNERLMKIAAHETSIPLHDRPLIIIHVVPFSTFAGTRSIDPVASVMNGYVVPIPPGRFGDVNQPFVNLDGYATVTQSTDGKTHAYAQLFRSGALEGVTTVEQDHTGKCYIAAPTFENNIIAALRNYLMFYKAIDVGLPIYVFLSFCGMSRCHFRMPTEYSSAGYYEGGPLQLDIVPLPEAAIDSDPPDIPEAMRVSFNTFWNAFGYPKSDKYNDKGEWIGTG